MKHDEKKSSEAVRFMDNLMSFLAEDDLHGKDLAEDLRARGLEPDQIVAEFRDLMKQHAPTWSEKAERERLAALDALALARETAHLPRIKAIEQINVLVEQMRQFGAPAEAGAYHQKFQEASDTDLESLLQDLRMQYELLQNQKNETGK
jgi:hypothetical protein